MQTRIQAARDRLKALFPSARVDSLEITGPEATYLLQCSPENCAHYLRTHGIETMDADIRKVWDDKLTAYEAFLDRLDGGDCRAVLANLIMVAVMHEEEETAQSLYNQLKVTADKGEAYE